ncbi:DUF202 domain-containing protein [Luteococcus sp. H138]|uniref:YidH family protein n=1 Tax=unclassified Luteococcus TaxID=2639923 RepID=UPI00313E0999
MNHRFPSSVYLVGEEPDARFTLANERTFLAWITFGLGMISLGVALESFALALEPHCRIAASVLLIVVGAFIPVQAWAGWKRVERALRLGMPLPSMVHGLVIAGCVVMAGVLVGIGVVLQ